MALLWSKNLNLKPLKFSGNPSPTIKRYLKDFAQNRIRSIKGLSLFTVFFKKLMAGMTVEAAVVLPVFMLFVMNLSGAIEMMRLHGKIQFALWETGNKTALYTYGMESGAAASLLSAVYIKSQIVESLGAEYLEQSPMKNGALGMKVLAERDGEDNLSVTVCYSVEPLYGFLGVPAFLLKNYYFAHLWNGYGIPEDAAMGEIVYMTENGTVYHVDRNCTHLRLSVRDILSETVAEQKNKWGRGYAPCERCARGEMPESLYVTNDGECYHYSNSCAGLKRTVFAVELEEIRGKYKSCSRCGG